MLVQNILKLRKHVGYDWKDFGVLYRVNSLSRSPELALRSASIPYRIVGGFSFFDRAEIKTVLSYLSLIANPYDTINFARAVSNPKRGVGKDTIGKLERASEQSEKSILEICKNVDDVADISGKARKSLREFSSLIEKSRKMEADGQDIGTIAKSLITKSGYYQSLKDQADLEPTDKPRFDNVEEFLSGIEDFASSHKGVTSSDYLQAIQLMTTDMQTSDGDEDAVQLLTMHSAKGLEWPVVHVIGVEDGTMPHGKALAERGIDEERRLMYVAMTRAMDYLVLSYCHLRRNRRAGKSTFLGEIYVDGSS